MQPLQAPKTIKVFQLLKQSGLYFSSAGSSSNANIGLGFYLTRDEAEQQRTLEVLKNSTSNDSVQYHIFELEIPNPAYRENK